jgi:hypothetical protein
LLIHVRGYRRGNQDRTMSAHVQECEHKTQTENKS